MKILLALVLFLVSGLALGVAKVTKVFTAVGAGVDHVSSSLDTSLYGIASAQCNWAGLTGTIDSIITLQSSDDGTTWVQKDGATVTLSGASGSTLMSVTNATELYYQVTYAHTDVTGGTITCLFVTKP